MPVKKESPVGAAKEAKEVKEEIKAEEVKTVKTEPPKPEPKPAPPIRVYVDNPADMPLEHQARKRTLK